MIRFLIILIIATQALWASTLDDLSYHDPKLNCVITGLVSWNIELLTNNYKVVFSPFNQNNEVFLGLTTYVAAEVISANGIYLIRAASHWDGMKILGVKEGDVTSNEKINVDERLSTLYMRSEIDVSADVVDEYVAEDIYIKNNVAYIVTARAQGEKWFQYKTDIRNIMKSFYLIKVDNGQSL